MYIDFHEALADGTIKAFYFSGGEPHVKIGDMKTDQLDIKANITNWEDCGLFLAFLNAVSHQQETFAWYAPTRIYLPYFPGSRQDRTDGYSPLTSTLYAMMLDAAIWHHFDYEFYTFDMHSQLGIDEIDSNFLWGALNNITVDELDVSAFDKIYKGFISPDKGALPRTTLFGSTFYSGGDLIVCEKTREFNTGHITSYEIPDDVEPGRYLVVDDICDGGATFNVLADSFAEKYGDKVELQLYVSHGIFSKGFAELEKRYSKIYTTDSFPHVFLAEEHPSVIEIPVPNPFVKVSETV